MEAFETNWVDRRDEEIPLNVRTILPPEGLDSPAFPVSAVSVHIDEKPQSIVAAKAKTFLNLIEGGAKPSVAAKAVRIPLTRILDSDQMKSAVTRIVTAGQMRNEVRKELVRAGLNLGLAETAEAGDWDMFNKLAKTVATDPDVGLNLPPVPTVSIDLGSLGDILLNNSLPGISSVPPTIDVSET